MMRASPAIRAFQAIRTLRAELKFRGLSTESIYRYLRVGRLYLKHSEGEMDRDTVVSFINSLNNCSGTSRRWCFDVIRVLFNANKVDWPFSKVDAPKKSRPFRPYLTPTDGEQLLSLCKQDPLARAIFRLSIITGLRRAELSALNEADLRGQELTVTLKKSDSIKQVALDAETVAILRTYIDTRESIDGALFVNYFDRRLSPWCITRLFQQYAKMMGLSKGTGMHSIRRGVVTWLHDRGMSEREIQEYIGWASPNMVHAYIQVDRKKVSAKAVSLHPLINR